MEDESLVVGILGPRGGGKTLLLSYFGGKALSQGYTVWSNYKISFDNKGKHHEALPLDMNALLTFSDELKHGFVLIDELQYFADAFRSSSNANKLLDSFIMQIRKRTLSLLYTVKFAHWVDKRIQYETDILVDCRDAYHTPWGKEKALKKGETFFLSFRDISGIMTGYRYREWPQIHQQIFNGNRFWSLYDDKEIIDVFEAMRPVANKLSVREISDAGAEYENMMERFGDGFAQQLEEILSEDRRISANELFGRLGVFQQRDRPLIKQFIATMGWEEKSSGGVKFFQKIRDVRETMPAISR